MTDYSALDRPLLLPNRHVVTATFVISALSLLLQLCFYIAITAGKSMAALARHLLTFLIAIVRVIPYISQIVQLVSSGNNQTQGTIEGIVQEVYTAIPYIINFGKQWQQCQPLIAEFCPASS